MTNLAAHFLQNTDQFVFGNFGMWAFLTVGAVVMFGIFIPLVTWIDGRRKEREAFYKADTFRRLAEASGEGARAAVELLREEDRLKRRKTIEGMKIAGIINLAVGIGLVIFLHAMLGGQQGSAYLCGLIPGLIGVGMLVYAFLLADPVL